jgi:hypothetical protein
MLVQPLILPDTPEAKIIAAVIVVAGWSCGSGPIYRDRGR